MSKNLWTVLLVATVALGALVSEATAAAASATAMAVSERVNPVGGANQVVVAAVQPPWDLVPVSGSDVSSERQLPQRFAEKIAGYSGFAAGASAGAAIGFAVAGPVGAVVAAALFSVAGEVIGEWIADNVFRTRGPYTPRRNPPLIPGR